MARRFERGRVVGTVDPPVDFPVWLRGQVEQAAQVLAGADFTAAISVHARAQALKEVELAWARSVQGAL